MADWINDACNIVDLVREIASYRKGLKPAFHTGHVIATINYLYNEGPAGRKILSKMLGLGETSVRSLLKRLQKHGLVVIDRVAGAYLTDKGREVAEKLRKYIRVKPATKILNWDNPILVAVMVKPPENTSVLLIRDKAVSVNADAALISVFDGADLKVPGLPIDKNEFRELVEELKKFSIEICGEECTLIYASLRQGPLWIEGLHLGFEILKHYCRRVRYC